MSQSEFRIRRISGGDRSAIAVWRCSPDLLERVAIHVPSDTRIGLRHLPLGPATEQIVVGRTVDMVEFTSHGGPAVANSIERTLGGANSHEPDQRHCLVARATTTRVADWLLRATDGGFANRLADSCHLTPEHARSIRRFADRLRRPPRVVLFGRPNVGKSSLLNRLIGFERAIVYDRAGVTRDAVATPAAFGGWPCELVDTAGGDWDWESLRTELDRQLGQREHLPILVVDATAPLTPRERTWASEGAVAAVVVTKSDLVNRNAMPERLASAISVSSETGDGLPTVVSLLASLLGRDEPSWEAPVPAFDDDFERFDAAFRGRLSRSTNQHLP